MGIWGLEANQRSFLVLPFTSSVALEELLSLSELRGNNSPSCNDAVVSLTPEFALAVCLLPGWSSWGLSFITSGSPRPLGF